MQFLENAVCCSWKTRLVGALEVSQNSKRNQNKEHQMKIFVHAAFNSTSTKCTFSNFETHFGDLHEYVFAEVKYQCLCFSLSQCCAAAMHASLQTTRGQHQL